MAISTKVMSFFLRARYAVTTSGSFLLMLIRMSINVGFVIIGVVILGVLCVGLATTTNLLRGTSYSGVKIWKDSLTSLWNQSMLRSGKR